MALGLSARIRGGRWGTIDCWNLGRHAAAIVGAATVNSEFGGLMREYFRACNVYCCPESNKAIVASVYNHGGMTAERVGGAWGVDFADSQALQCAIQTALDRCEYKENFNYSGLKRTDWPAFEVSGYKAIKRFEADFTRLDIRGVNEKNLFYEMTSPEFGEFGLQLKVVVNSHTAEHGVAAQYLVARYLACKSAGQGAAVARGLAD